jgi:hypothetical protein
MPVAVLRGVVTEWPPADPTETTDIAEHRDDVLAAVRDHAGRLAYELARLEGGDYGQKTVETDRGEWTVKYEAGDLEYLRFDPNRGAETYVVSTKQPAEPAALADALTDYDAFVAGFNEYVRSLEGVLDDVPTEFPAVTSTDGVVAERDRVLDRVREVCDHIAGQLHRYEGGDYGTFTTRVDGTRWELKWDRDGVSYLRAGGSNGVYLISQYDQPAAADIREYAPRFHGFVVAYNDHVEDLEADLATVSL